MCICGNDRNCPYCDGALINDVWWAYWGCKGALHWLPIASAVLVSCGVFLECLANNCFLHPFYLRYWGLFNGHPIEWNKKLHLNGVKVYFLCNYSMGCPLTCPPIPPHGWVLCNCWLGVLGTCFETKWRGPCYWRRWRRWGAPAWMGCACQIWREILARKI